MELVDDSTWLGAPNVRTGFPSRRPARSPHRTLRRRSRPLRGAHRHRYAATIDDQWIRHATPDLGKVSARRTRRRWVIFIAAFVVGFALAFALELRTNETRRTPWPTSIGQRPAIDMSSCNPARPSAGRRTTTSCWTATCGSPGTTPASTPRRAMGAHRLQSANGTTVNGQRVTTHSLRHGDRIRFGGMPPSSSFRVPTPWPRSPRQHDAERPPRRRCSPEREREILALVGAGRTDREIAEELFISVATVRSHLDRIRDKTGCPPTPRAHPPGLGARHHRLRSAVSPAADLLLTSLLGQSAHSPRSGWSSLPLLARVAPRSHC